MLELQNVSYTVEDNGQAVEIVNDVSFKVDDQKFVVITGPNGGGKSTLARLISGVAIPTGGRIIFDGKDITKLGITERAKLGIGYALQQPVRFKGIDVKDLLRIAAGHNLTTDESCSYLSRVGLCARDYINREVNASLSGGELKRIEIATLLARKPKLSVFDEPEAGIDLWSFQSLIRVFELMRSEIEDGSILIISHQERILDIADEIIVIADGRVERQGPRDEILPSLVGTTSAISGCTRLVERS